MSYFRPQNLDEAIHWLGENGGTIAAGCTDLFPATHRASLSGPVLDITAIEALKQIEKTTDGWRIGAAATWSDVITADLPPAFDGLKLAAREVGSKQIQNAGTVGGNLCNASPAADGVPCLMTLDASVEIASAAGTRTLPLQDFILGPRRTALQEGDILSAILIPESADAGQSDFVKLGARKYLVISISMAAARLVIEGGTIADAALSVGASSAVAVRLPQAEAVLRGQPANAATAALTSDEMVTSALSPIDDIRSTGTYRLAASAELVRQTIANVIENATEAST